MKNTIFDPTALKDIIAWSRDEPKLVKKIFDLIADIHKHPFEGLGKPEGLKHQFKGCWSRRITDEHRLIYKVLPDEHLHHECSRTLFPIISGAEIVYKPQKAKTIFRKTILLTEEQKL